MLSATPAESAAVNTAMVPTPKIENDFYDWHARHEEKVTLARRRNHDMVFIGDSITHLFEGDPNLPGRGEDIWRKYYGDRALNLGFGWDRTQNVLWRLEHGEMAGQTPRLIVLLIGTNNLSATANARANTPPEIAQAISLIVDQLKELSPASRILMLGLLPRGAVQDQFRLEITQVNSLVKSAVSKQKRTDFLDFGSAFLASDGTIPVSLMEDGVHPTTAGYRLWADAIAPFVPEV
jgi:lysophospholipase L1-like esterase